MILKDSISFWRIVNLTSGFLKIGPDKLNRVLENWLFERDIVANEELWAFEETCATDATRSLHYDMACLICFGKFKLYIWESQAKIQVFSPTRG